MGLKNTGLRIKKMTEDKRFISDNGGYGVYDKYTGERYTRYELTSIVNIMNNLDTKARERSKALSTLQKKYDYLNKIIDALEAGSARKIEDLIYEYCSDKVIKDLGWKNYNVDEEE